jgi:hypothetical protein
VTELERLLTDFQRESVRAATSAGATAGERHPPSSSPAFPGDMLAPANRPGGTKHDAT